MMVPTLAIATQIVLLEKCEACICGKTYVLNSKTEQSAFTAASLFGCVVPGNSVLRLIDTTFAKLVPVHLASGPSSGADVCVCERVCVGVCVCCLRVLLAWVFAQMVWR